MKMIKVLWIQMLKGDGHCRSSSFLSIISSLIMILSVLPTLAMSVQNPPTDRGDGTLENSGDWVIEEGDDIQYTDETIVINGNLTIEGKLTLTRCVLIMNMSYSTLTVNGTLTLETTNITGNNTYYYFIVTGTLDFHDSNLFHIAGSDDYPYIGGLQLLSEDVSMEGGSIRDAEFTGLYIRTDVTLSNISIINNIFNVVMNGSSPGFINCSIRFVDFEGSVSIFMMNGSHPIFVEGTQMGGIDYDDQLSSMGFGHTLSVHVTYENGTSIPGATVTATSNGDEVSEQRTTDGSGWVRNLLLPEETHYLSLPDKVYRPYRVTVEKFDLMIMESVPFESETTLEMVLTGDYFGETLTRGDYNGDGFLDLAVGVPRNRTGVTTPGAVFVFLNRGDLELTEIDESMADLTIRGVDGTGFGSVLSSGDFNGDGFDDLLLGTPLSSENGAESGRVYFFFGNPAPAWNDLEDASLTFEGDEGTHYGSRLFAGNLNNDAFSDFVIGDDQNSFVYFSTANPGQDFNSISEFTLYATGKGSADDTSQSVTETQFDDEVRYDLDPQEEMHITDFAMGNFRGDPAEIILKFQFVTDRYYGYNSGERSYVYYSLDGDNWHQTTMRPRWPDNNWDEETTLTFDLLSDGVTSMEQLKNIEIYYKNDEGQEGNDHYIHIDYVQIHISAVPKGANHTLEAGNISSGDVNGDGYADLIISDVSGQTVYYGGPLGISAPETLQMDLRQGNATRLIITSGNLTISETRTYLNGQFDDGWDGWFQVSNSMGQKDGSTRWDIVESANGDWDLHEGPTAGFGVNQDTLDEDDNRDCRGMLRTQDFLITEDMDTLHFWYDFGARRFDPQGGWGQSYDDQIRYRLFSADNDSVLMELAGWASTSSNEGHDENGTVDADITGLRGEKVYFGFEIITNRGSGERGIAQIDNLTILPPSAVPYYENGSIESPWFEFEGNISTITPVWDSDVTGGELSLRFRTEPEADWNDTSDSISGRMEELNGSSDRLQYRIEMTGDGSGTPSMRGLELAILLEGQIIPLALNTDYGSVITADMNGDGIDDLLYSYENGSTRGTRDTRGTSDTGSNGIDIFHGNENFSAIYNASDIQEFFTGDVTAFSVLDLESDGTDELCLIGDSIRIIDGNTDVQWEKSVMASRISGDVASDPSYHLNTGAINFIPSHDSDIRVVDIDIPQFIDPDSPQLITLVICNIGIDAQSDLTYYCNVTAGDYTYSNTDEISIQPFESESIGFLWSVPVDEGIDYTISLEVPLAADRVNGDNNLTVHATSKEHGILLITDTPVLSAHGGDYLSYNITIENIGTFETENVTMSSILPQDWTGEYRYLDVPVDYIVVADSTNITFRTASPIDEEEGDFTINLTSTAATAVSYLNTTATILRPELIIEEIQLLRQDGVVTNDTIHGVSGDQETVMIKVNNTGSTYATEFWLEVQVTGYADEDFYHSGLASGESIWITKQIVPEEGTLEVSAFVDSDSDVPEQNESNNTDSREFTIKGQDPIGSYEITGMILDIQGEGVGFAEVVFEWDGNNENTLTDDSGNFAFTIEAPTFHDTTLLYLNATDGENITSVQIILYSEDGGKHFILTLNQYLVEMEGPDRVSSIDIDGTITIQVDVTNKGNVNTTFVVEAFEVPDDWTVEVTDLPEGKVTLSIEETVSLEIKITSSDNPLHAKGNQKYFITILVFSEIYPPGNDSFTHGIVVQPMQSILVLTDGENTTSVQPGEEIGFSFIVENLGNEGNTFIPELVGNSVDEVEDFEFDITYVSLDIGESAGFSLVLTMPFLEFGAGTELEVLVGGADDHITSASIFLTALEFYAIQYDCPTEFDAKPGDVLIIPISIINTGNLEENITLTGWTETPDVQIEDGYVILSMLEETSFSLKVTLPGGALAGEVIPLVVDLSTGPDDFLSIQVNITIIILEVYGMSMTLIERTVSPGSDFTVYSYEIEARNDGNGENTFHFKAEGSHPGYLAFPEPLTLGPGVTETIYAEIIVPLNNTGVIDNYLVAVDVREEYDDLNLRILSYDLDIETSIEMSQTDSGNDHLYYYDVSVTNNGERFERLNLLPSIPQVNTYQSGDVRWEGEINKDFLEILPGETEDFRLWVSTPELREYWGTALFITLESDSGKTEELTLHKAPIAILGSTIPDSPTFEDTITFTGSQSMWNILDYQWDLGDGSNATGSSVSYSYGRSGEYEVTLTITDDMGFTATKSTSIEILNQLPIAVIQTNPRNRTVEAGLPITLDSSFSHDRDGEVVSYLWEFGEFGDFYEGTWPVIQHIYETTGVFTVTLNVRDNFGATTNTSVVVTVIPKTQNPDQPDDVVTEEITSTDPMSYIPMVILVLVALASVVFLGRKKMVINHNIRKITDQTEKEQNKRK